VIVVGLAVAKSIEAIGTTLGETMRKLKPKKATISFGIEVQMEAGKLTALICKVPERPISISVLSG
jgi:hypothetical protein